MYRKIVYSLLAVVLVLTVVTAACSKAAPTTAPTTATTTVTATTTAPATTAPAKIYKMKFAVYWAETLAYSDIIKWWLNEIEKRSGGRIDVTDVYWASSIGPTADHLDIVGTGIVQGGIIGIGYTPTKLPLSGAFELIYQAPSPWVKNKAINEIYATNPAFRKEYQQHNVVYMTVAETGSEPLLGTNKPIKTVADMKGVKMRAYGRLTYPLQQWGAVPVAMTFADIYESMQRGTLDGYTGAAWGGIYGAKLNEVTKYFTSVGMGPYAFSSYVMNLDFYNSLPDDLKDIVAKLNADMPDMTTTLVAEPEYAAARKLAAEGKTIYVLPPDEAQKWKDLVIPGAWDAWVDEMTKAGVPGAANFLKAYQDALKKYAPQDKWPKLKI